MLRTRQRSPQRTESGAVAIMVALSMVGLCVAAGFVVDLGLLRVDHQVNKSAQDAAATAGANGLVLDLNNPTAITPFAGVCQALNYLKANDGTFADATNLTWTNGNGGPIAGSPDGCNASHASDKCTPDAPATWARLQATANAGKYQVTIQSGYKILAPGVAGDATYGDVNTVTGGAFAEDRLYTADGGEVAMGGCDQVAVIVTESRGTTLGAPAAPTMGTRVRSVARLHIGAPKAPFALLLLERRDCQVLANTSNGTIDVTGYKMNPGMIHLDSDGSGASCNKSLIVGAKTNGVVAHEAPLPAGAGAPGEISMVATSNRSDGIPNVYSGPSPGKDPTTSGLVTREVLDTIYLDPVTTAKNEAKPYLTAASAAALPAPPTGAWATKSTCNQPITGNELYVFIDCTDVSKDVTLPNAKIVVFKGSISGANVQLPVATRVYVVGQSSPAKGISVGSASFSMNDGGAACPSTFDTSKSRARLVLLNSDLKANGGTFRACNTTVMLLGGDLDGCLPTSTPTYYPAGNVCPGGSAGTGFLTLGGNTTIDWTAPDTVDDDLVSTDPANVAAHADLEDLALWTETYGTHTLGGGGTMHLAGVFAAPNAHDMKLNGGPTQNVKNSQYVVRSLQTTGSGTLQMTPTPSLPISPPNISFELVR